MGLIPILLLGFQNCSEADFVRSEELESLSEPLDFDRVRSVCENSSHQEKITQIRFNDPGQTCLWETQGNLSIRDGYFRARTEQTESLGLPNDAIICGAEFEFAVQQFKYDDVFILALNNNILASSYLFEDEFNESNGYLIYDWNALVGGFWDNDGKSMDYCVGGREGQSTCSFPSQSELGVINLSIPPELIQGAMANSGFGDHSMKMVTTGDNDSTDCQHFDIEFSVKVSYVQ